MKTVKLSGKDAMVPSAAGPRLSTDPGQVSEAIAPAHPARQADPDESEQFREEIRRRYELPFRHTWRHGGLND
jgi:hypothetical protein